MATWADFAAEAPAIADDGRYALHAQDPNVPFEVDDTYRLFEFLIDHAVLGERATPDDWPPRHTTWRVAVG